MQGECSHCGEERVATGNSRIVFTDDELAMVERFLGGRCFPCWKHENVVSFEELAQAAATRKASADSRRHLRQQAHEIARERRGMWLEQINCHHCQNEATMVVVGNGDKLAQVKVLCSRCKTYWL